MDDCHHYPPDDLEIGTKLFCDLFASTPAETCPMNITEYRQQQR